MSQNPNSDPNERSEEPTLRNPYFSPPPGTGYGGPRPPSGPPSGPPPEAYPPSSYGIPSIPPPPPPGGGTGPRPNDPYTPPVFFQTHGPTYPTSPSPTTKATPTPPSPAPAPRASLWQRDQRKKIIAAGLALIVLLGGTILAYAVNRHNQSVTTANANATATAIASTYPFSNKLVLNDLLTNASQASQHDWDNYGINCFFSGGSYHVVEHEQLYRKCIAHHTNYADFAYQVQMTIQQGGNSTSGGLIFRQKAETNQAYVLYLNAQGSYEIALAASQNASGFKELEYGSIPGFTPGLGQTHTLGLVARGDHFAFYVDAHKVTEITDNRYTNGQIGVIAVYNEGNTPAEVIYKNAKVWAL